MTEKTNVEGISLGLRPVKLASIIYHYIKTFERTSFALISALYSSYCKSTRLKGNRKPLTVMSIVNDTPSTIVEADCQSSWECLRAAAVRKGTVSQPT